MSQRDLLMQPVSNGQPLSAEDFRANHIVLQENVQLLVMTAISGRNCGESLGRLNPDGSLVRMFQGCAQANLEGSLDPSFMIFPKWGTVSDGVVGKLPMLELSIIEKGSSLLPTCRSHETGDYQYSRGDHNKKTPTLTGAVKMLPTPTTPRAHDSDNTAGKYYPSQTQNNLGRYAFLFPTPTDRDHKDVGDLGSRGGKDESGCAWQTWTGRIPLERIWVVEPPMGRVAHGVPRRVDRLRCLGNAVVPQQVYPILKAIAEIEKGGII